MNHFVLLDFLFTLFHKAVRTYTESDMEKYFQTFPLSLSLTQSNEVLHNKFFLLPSDFFFTFSLATFPALFSSKRIVASESHLENYSCVRLGIKFKKKSNQ